LPTSPQESVIRNAKLDDNRTEPGAKKAGACTFH
jgi:hypothetical protein